MINWLIEFIATFCESFLCTVFCGTFLPEPNNKKFKITVPVILTAIILLMNSINLYSPVTVFVTVIIFIVLQSIVYKNILKTSAFSFLFLMILT
ncbi:MAG: hypothetical protein K2N27_02690, partial [Ruminococcus sp.]|nr:hypothetical protein [Ruminococcus sp.]